VLGAEAALRARDCAHPCAPVLHAARVQALCRGGRRVTQAHPDRVEPPAEVEILIQERELFVETVDAREQRALDGDVGGVEAPPSRLAALDRAEVELEAALEPAHERCHPQLFRPAHVPEHSELVLGMAGVQAQMLRHQAFAGDDVIADEEHNPGLGGAPAGVARRGRPRGAGAEHPGGPCDLRGLASRRVQHHQHLDLLRGDFDLTGQRVERAAQPRGIARQGRDHDAHGWHGET